jgi:hypothetical protein
VSLSVVTSDCESDGPKDGDIGSGNIAADTDAATNALVEALLFVDPIDEVLILE